MEYSTKGFFLRLRAFLRVGGPLCSLALFLAVAPAQASAAGWEWKRWSNAGFAESFGTSNVYIRDWPSTTAKPLGAEDSVFSGTVLTMFPAGCGKNTEHVSIDPEAHNFDTELSSAGVEGGTLTVKGYLPTDCSPLSEPFNLTVVLTSTGSDQITYEQSPGCANLAVATSCIRRERTAGSGVVRFRWCYQQPDPCPTEPGRETVYNSVTWFTSGEAVRVFAP